MPNWTAAMRRGDFEAAWRQTDRIEIPRRRAQQRPGFQRGDHQLVWDGSPLDGQTVLVRCRHGLGDTIQFLRYAPLLRSRARRVIVPVQPMLLSLFAGMEGIDDLRNGWTDEPDPAHDVEIECMELPYAFRSTLETLPATVPYLPVERFRRVTPALDGDLRVGLVWASSAWNSRRSLPLSCLAPLASIPGVSLYGLQQGPERAEVDSVSFPVTSLSDSTTEVADAASAMLAMDLILSVDTMAAHLAGALGRPTWLLLQHEADWRWMDGREDSPWYPTMRLFRQPRPGDWEGAVARLVAALKGMARSSTAASLAPHFGVPRRTRVD